MKKYKLPFLFFTTLAVSCGSPHRNKVAITECNASRYFKI